MQMNTMTTNEYTNLERILAELKAIAERESKRCEMSQHLTSSMLSLLEDEVIPLLENEIDYDPTPEHLYDHSGGEPPVSMTEIWKQSYYETQLLHS